MNKIKITSLVLIMIFLIFSGCSRKGIDEKEFLLVWQEYLTQEFEESFDEKQSVSQREKIMSGILSEHNISLEELKSFMENNHKDKYNKIFVE